jgi:hypothetical protein
VSTGGPFPGGKSRPGSDADNSPPSSAEVKNELELYLLSSHALPWRVAGSLYLYLIQTLVFAVPRTDGETGGRTSIGIPDVSVVS